jgi:hypothetical protein
MCLAVSCGRYSPDEMMDTYDAYSDGIDQVDTAPIETWADESADAATELAEAVQQMIDTVEMIDAWATTVDQETINEMLLYWANNNTELQEWMQYYPAML